MGTTPTLLLPYPEPTDPADVPTDMNELATRIEAVRGTANGLASLDGTGKVPAAQLPAVSTAGQQLAYAEATSSLSVTATSEGTSQGVVSAPATVFDGGPVIVEFSAPVVQPPQAAAAGITLYLSLDGAIIGILGRLINPAANVMGVPVLVHRRLTPTAASHTFVIGTSVSAGTGTIVAGPGGAGQFLPAYIRITRA